MSIAHRHYSFLFVEYRCIKLHCIMKNSLKIISVFAGILIGVLVMAQFRTAVPLGSSYAVDQVKAQKELIKSYIDDEAALKSRISNLREKIDKNLEQNALVTKTTNLEILNGLKEQVGLTELEGPGFIIQLDDSPFIDRENISNEEQGIVYAADIRDIVNLLRANNVQGISINEQRIIVTSSITSVGNTILVNNSNLAPPFTISAIGDYDSFLIRLSDPTVLPDLQKRIKENGIQFNTQQMPYVVLPVYNGQFRLNYLKELDAQEI